MKRGLLDGMGVLVPLVANKTNICKKFVRFGVVNGGWPLGFHSGIVDEKRRNNFNLNQLNYF